jgi:hypothetical protein
MFNTFKKMKIPDSKPEADNKNFKDTLQDNSKLFAKYKDLNLQTQILKEYPINFLEMKSEENIFFESIMVLQNKVYNQIYSMFFDNNNIDQQQ